jgi:hypothetical protein
MADATPTTPATPPPTTAQKILGGVSDFAKNVQKDLDAKKAEADKNRRPPSSYDPASAYDDGGKVKMEHTPEEKRHFQRGMHKLHTGALHRHLGIPEGEKIPLEKKQEAANSSNKHVAAMGRMALAMHGWKH